jgi:uncharacterized damage-inducible protein DinB
MNSQPYSHLVRYKQWADRGLYEVLAQNVERLPAEDATNLLRVLDHIQAVDWIFQHHLQGRPHDLHAPRSAVLPDLPQLAKNAQDVGDWYVSYVGDLSAPAFEQAMDFAFTNGTPTRMTRGEIILHVCLHGTYHRGNAGVLLLKNGISPNQDRLTDFLEAAA